MAHHLFTSESVTEGHPEKVCDQISDAVLDAILEQDPEGRVACEVVATTGMVTVMGEISTSCYVDIPRIVRETVREIGYDRAGLPLRSQKARRPQNPPRHGRIRLPRFHRNQTL